MVRDDEREQVEYVFGLTGGELDDEPWGGFKYNYDGPPDYAASDYPDRYDFNVQYRTVIGDFLFGGPPEVIEDDQGVWHKSGMFTTSGETECPLHDQPVEEERCPLCDEARGDEHGYIYIGDGWAEVIFRLELPEEDEE
jgi:hypothetical protein